MSAGGAASAAEIRVVLDGEDVTWCTAIAVLGLALRWSADELRSDDVALPAAAFRAVARADQALAAVPEFYRALSHLVARGEPAGEVAADLRRQDELFAGLAAEIGPLRARLSELVDAEDRYKAEIAQRDQLAARISDLERLERLAGEVAALREQHDRLAERTRSVAGPVAAAEARLSAVTGPLVTLTTKVLDELAEQNRTLLLRAAEQDTELRARLAEHRQTAARLAAKAEHARATLAAAEAEAAKQQSDYENYSAEAANRRIAMRRHHKANQDVAEALAGRPPRPGEQPADGPDGPDGSHALAQAVRALGEVETRLAEIDTMLATALSPGEE